MSNHIDNRGTAFGKQEAKPNNQDYLDYVPDESRDKPEQNDLNLAKITQNAKSMASKITGDKQLIEETKMNAPSSNDPMFTNASKKIADREDEYHQGRFRRRELSEERHDPFAAPANKVGVKRKYRDIIEE